MAGFSPNGQVALRLTAPLRNSWISEAQSFDRADPADDPFGCGECPDTYGTNSVVMGVS